MRSLVPALAGFCCLFSSFKASALDLKIGIGKSGSGFDLPPMPSLLVPRTEIPDISEFPTPVCLQKNIRFWEQIYADLDSNEAFLHDRNNLGRIYARIRLPVSAGVRKLAVAHIAETYRTKLLNLAEIFDTPKRWSTQDKEIALQFEDGELSRANLIAAADNLRIQTGLKARFEAGVHRSLNYLPTIRKVVSDAGLPVDIMMLPHVESSFVAHAQSKVGAQGLWQLMPGTMRLLLGSSAVGKRHEIETSTIAATKLLRQNFEATRSWPLALTAYNHGLNGVMRGMRDTRSNDLCEIIAKYQSPSFRFASSNFYAQFLAARNVAQVRYLALEEVPAKGGARRQALASAKGIL